MSRKRTSVGRGDRLGPTIRPRVSEWLVYKTRRTWSQCVDGARAWSRAQAGICARSWAWDERPGYARPDWVTQHVINPLVAALTRWGVSVVGSRILRVRGRTSGAWRGTPINLLTIDSNHYLVAPRGETQWVRNLRAAGGGESRVGRRIQPFTAEEIGEDDKAAVLRAYLQRWRRQVGALFGGSGPTSSDEELRAEGVRHPVFRLHMIT